MKNKICNENYIWDLHIHTCKCPKGSSEFCQLSVNEYVDKLERLFSNYKDLKMISFTDHNFISIEVYKEFAKRKIDIKLIPGIEVDVCLNKDNMNDFKHIIFYFNDELFDLEKHGKLINDKLRNNPIYLYEFLEFLIIDLKGVSFLMSPHFKKQGKRDLDYDWNNEEFTRKNISKYIDQFFCFWETSSVKNIAMAEEFLKEFVNEKRISIISFSDSNSMGKLESYLNSPCQYFNALPTFNGLRMVGSDCRRILRNKYTVSDEEKGKYIGKVVQGNNIIEFSSKLNTVIGGRGSGKSLLIDSIELSLSNDEKDNKLIEKDRKQFIHDLNYEIYDMKNKKLKDGGFKIDYYNQGYILNLFKNETNFISSNYFKDEFLKLKKYDINNKKSEIINDLDFKENIVTETNDNIVSIAEVIKKIKENNEFIKFKKSTQVNTVLEYKDINTLKRELNKTAILHKELKDNPRIVDAQNKLILIMDEELYKFNNQKIICSVNVKFKDKYEKKILELNLEKQKKNKLLNRIKIEIINKSVKYINRVKIINCILNLENKYSEVDRTTSSGYKESQFIFERKIKVENFEDYLYRVFNEYFDHNKTRSLMKIDKKDRTKLLELIEAYCFNAENIIMESKNITNLDSELYYLSSLKIDIEENIYYKENSQAKEINLRKLSPGTKANLLMEYIVFKESSIPLLIDQPEDNIDNSTIYGKLTLWFENLKQKRQVIVATHDPNLVINADSENVIICNQEKDNEFLYKYGALEYENNIEKIANILDGGKEAIERRLLKYGK